MAILCATNQSHKPLVDFTIFLGLDKWPCQRSFTMRFLLFATLVAPIASQNCSINCHPGSSCVSGEADFSQHPTSKSGLPFFFLAETSKDGWHCDCPDNMTGLRCNRPYENCGNGHFCYHGGKCIGGLNDTIDEALMFCDCNDAQHSGVPYVGKHCEMEGAVQCGDTEIFCTNRGTCVDGFETKAHPCSCSAGHRGPHCEFDTGLVPECTLQCQNGGACSLGIKDYDTALHAEFWALYDNNFMYCECPEGWFGLTCEVPGAQCGDITCFNGAGCLQTEHSDGQVEYTCDCSVAGTDTTSYAGEFCENEATTFCTKNENQNGQLFCVNGGVCKEDEEKGCECPQGFHGPICEYRDSQEPEACRLQCQNGGECRSGKKDNKLFLQFGAELKKFNQTHRLWEHCVCPDGFFGIQCEHQLEICPGGEHICLHGSQCVAGNPETDGSEHVCDCEQAYNTTQQYAGKYCQYSSTDICTKNMQSGLGNGNFAFCVNDGKCKSKVEVNEPHPGCTCPDGFKGPHCEFLEGTPTAPVSTNTDSTGSSGGLVIVLAVAMLVMAVLVAGTLLKKHWSGVERDSGKEKQKPSTPTSEDSAVVTEETVDMQSPDITLDPLEKDLQTVEII